MAKPWEKYQASAKSESAASDVQKGPWESYAQRTPPAVETPAKGGETEGPGLLSRGLDYAVRGLDYLGGIGRASAVTMADLQQMRHDPKHEFTVTADDVERIVKGDGPTSAEYLERNKVPEGPSVGIPFTDRRISARDTVGFLGDVATDPLTYGASKLLKPVGTAMESTGKTAYKSGFKKIDESLAEKGKGPLSDVLLAEGKTGTTKKLAGDVQELSKQAAKERDALYKQVTEKGATVDMAFPMENAERVLSDMRRNPGLEEQADALSKMLEKYKKAGKVPVSDLSEWKTSLYDALPQAAYSGPGVSGVANEFKQALAKDFQQAIIGAGNAAEKGLGDKIAALNEKWGTLLSAERPLALQARRGTTANLGTAVDGILLGTGNAAALPAKKAFDAAKTTYARTKVGKGLIDAGKSGVPDALIRQGILEAERRKRRGLLEQQPGLIVPVTEGYEQ